MRYLVRANARRSDEGKPQEPPTYWLPEDKGYSRTGSIDEALAYAFATRANALAYMESQGVEENEANEVIELP